MSALKSLIHDVHKHEAVAIEVWTRIEKVCSRRRKSPKSLEGQISMRLQSYNTILSRGGESEVKYTEYSIHPRCEFWVPFMDCWYQNHLRHLLKMQVPGPKSKSTK